MKCPIFALVKHGEITDHQVESKGAMRRPNSWKKHLELNQQNRIRRWLKMDYGFMDGL